MRLFQKLYLIIRLTQLRPQCARLDLGLAHSLDAFIFSLCPLDRTGQHSVHNHTRHSLHYLHTMESERIKLKIAIIGGGICGLALAAGLCKLPNLDVHVYEAVSEYRGKPPTS